MIVRLLLLVLNTVAFVYLLLEMFRIYDQMASGQRKTILLTAGIMLIILPVVMIMGFIKPTPVYWVVYPAGLLFFSYLCRFLRQG